MKETQIVRFSSLATLITVIAIISLNAKASNNSEKRLGHLPATIDVCKGKAAGNAVTISGREGEKVEAVCKKINGQLAAVRNNAPPKRLKQ
ncbi:MAG: hypothetical protein ACI8ZB_003700 [Desulforhopalus sp.]|jgi:hypothetical protein